jgi:hypothetical protein
MLVPGQILKATVYVNRFQMIVLDNSWLAYTACGSVDCVVR